MHVEAKRQRRKTTKIHEKGMQAKIQGKAKTLQNKGFAPKSRKSHERQKPQKNKEKTGKKQKGEKFKKKSAAKPNTCKIKGLPRIFEK